MPLPKILDIGFKIDEPKLWNVDLPVEEILISEIEHNMDIPYLEQEGTNDWNLTPRMLVQNFDKEFHHAKQTDAADLQYPIELYFHLGKRIILDGVHRYVKALRQWEKTIKVRRVSDEIIQQVKKSDADWKKRKGEK